MVLLLIGIGDGFLAKDFSLEKIEGASEFSAKILIYFLDKYFQFFFIGVSVFIIKNEKGFSKFSSPI